MKQFILFWLIFLSQQICQAQNFDEVIHKASFLIKNHQKQTNIPGIQIAVLIDGDLVWSQGFGYKNLEKNELVNDSTKFRIASISKSLTSMALGKLVESGSLDLDSDIRQYIPEFPDKSSKITARQLAGSISGIRHYNDDDPSYNKVHYPDVISSLKVFQDDPLEFEPGTKYLYSSFGWVLLSAVMEKASKKPFSEIMEQTWSDLEMEHTTFDIPKTSIDNISKFYVYDKTDGRKIAPEDNRSYMYAGGGFLSTANDLATMGWKLIDNQYLNQETYKTLTESLTLANGTKTNYGLGWECGNSRLGTPIIYHSGNMSSTRSHLVIYPEEKVVIAYIANTGQNIFFNEREAHTIAELFVLEKRNQNKEHIASNLEGEWKIETTSLRNKKSKGFLKLKLTENGSIEGEITFIRSRKKETFPIILSDFSKNKAHLIAISPMFIDFYLNLDRNTLSGVWLHDFNINGIPDEDKYWLSRRINGEKVSNKK